MQTTSSLEPDLCSLSLSTFANLLIDFRLSLENRGEAILMCRFSLLLSFYLSIGNAQQEPQNPTILAGVELHMNTLSHALQCLASDPGKPQIEMKKSPLPGGKFLARVIKVPVVLTSFAAKVLRDLRARTTHIIIQVLDEHIPIHTIELQDGSLLAITNMLGYGVVGLYLPMLDPSPIAGVLYTPFAAHRIYLSARLSPAELIETMAHELGHAWLRSQGLPWRHPEADKEIASFVKNFLKPPCLP